MNHHQPKLKIVAALIAGITLFPAFAPAADIAIPTVILKQGVASNAVPLFSTSPSLQTGLALRAQVGDGDGPGSEPTFTSANFNLPLWQQFSNIAFGGPVAGAPQYIEAGVIYAEPGRSAAATGEFVRLGLSTVGTPIGTYPLALSATDIGADTTFLATGGALVPTTIANGQTLVYGTSLSIPANTTNAVAYSPLSSTSLTVSGKLRVAPNSGTSVVSTLSVTGSGFVDLTDNDLIVRGTSVAAVRNLVAQWRTASSGLPGSVGLGSSLSFYSAEGAFTTLAVYDNSIAGQTRTTFNGIAVSPSDVLVKYTYLGDTNLDGAVNATDIARILQGMNGQGTGWNFGDVNYDGAINALDLGRAMAALRGQGAPLAGSNLGGAGGGAIPEPASLAPMLAAAALLERRRR